MSLTSAEVNALPERIRRHIHDVETICDPAGMVQEIAALKDQVLQLTKQVGGPTCELSGVCIFQARPGKKSWGGS